MEKLVQEALKQYNFRDPVIDFIRHNENITYKITDDTRQYVLRIHKPIKGFSLGIFSENESRAKYLESEMLILDYYNRKTSRSLQRPVDNKKGTMVSILSDKTPVTVLEWIPGNTLSDSTLTEELGKTIGEMIAWLHQCSELLKIDHQSLFSKSLNREINRYKYTQPLLKKIEEQLIIATEIENIDKQHLEILRKALNVIKTRMDELAKNTNMMGIVHSDLSPSNLIISDNEIIPIDFSLSGYGFFYMDIGMAVSQYKDKSIRNSIKKGYEKVVGREVPVCYIDAFFALGVLLFISCQHNKAHKEDWFEGAMNRWCSTLFSPLVEGKQFSL